ncbi:MAG: ABC transporter permease subunit, partial [Nitriliruptoraceae bacterium]
MIETVLFDALRAAIGPTAAAYALLAVGLNLHFGYTGLLNFGQVGFMLVG